MMAAVFVRYGAVDERQSPFKFFRAAKYFYFGLFHKAGLVRQNHILAQHTN
jgi:hypothetical protein